MPVLFTNLMKGVIAGITVCLVALGVMSQYKLVLGLN